MCGKPKLPLFLNFRCASGYYGNPVLASGSHCRPCPCPESPSSGRHFAAACHQDSRSGTVMCSCLPGYTGKANLHVCLVKSMVRLGMQQMWWREGILETTRQVGRMSLVKSLAHDFMPPQELSLARPQELSLVGWCSAFCWGGGLVYCYLCQPLRKKPFALHRPTMWWVCSWLLRQPLAGWGAMPALHV